MGREVAYEARPAMKRRTLLQQGPVWLAAPAWAQSAAPRLVAVLSSFAAEPGAGGTISQEMARLGWRPGENLRLELRYADNEPGRLDALARELVALQPAVALAVNHDALRALMRHTTHIPLVVGFAGDPVASGLAASLQRPGGQVTGLTLQFDDIRPMTYQLARQVAPAARRLAGLFWRDLVPEAQFDAAMERLRRLARRVNLEYLPLPVRSASEIEAAVRALTPPHDHVLLLNTDEVVFSKHAAVAALARSLGLPSGAQYLAYPRAGGLFAYGPNFQMMWLRAIQMVDQVLRGRPVGEIPFEQPTRILFVLNRSTARGIGLSPSNELLLRADEVIG